MTAPLYEALLRHQSLGRSSFHTPGHKSAPDVFPDGLLSLDYTELPDTDSLYEASGVILRAEELAARLYGAARTLFSACGCTLCIQAMLRIAAPRPGSKVICGRIIHRSAVNTMALLGLEPVWISPRQDAGPFLPGRISAEDIRHALQQNPDASCVYLTSPDYYGVLSDIPAIAKECRAASVPLLIDNAHGSHLRFTRTDLHPLTLGATMTACSAHKTLPVLTGGAWLHISDPQFASSAKSAMALFGSTSPSYPIMASLDLAREWLEAHGKEAFGQLQDQVAALRMLAEKQGIPSPEGFCDPVRLSLCTAAVGMTGIAAADHFRNHGIEPEYADGAYLVLLPSPFHSPKDFDRLREAILTLPKGPGLVRHPALPPLPPVAVTPREALFGDSEEIPLSSACGRIATEAACPCPPGIPIVMPGEKITPDCIEFLSGYGFFTIKVLK